MNNVPEYSRDEYLPRKRGEINHGATIRSIDELDEPFVKRDVVWNVDGATVVWADYGAILEDFPFLRSIWHGPEGAVENDAVDHWLTEQAAVVSRSQLEAQADGINVNSHVRTRGAARVAYRPPEYGRALVVPLIHCERLQHRAHSASSPAFLDIKGCGVGPAVKPRLSYHGTGLLPLYQAFYELLNQRLVEALSRRALLNLTGVKVYALIKLGFAVQETNGSWVAAGAMVRRAHRRAKGGGHFAKRASDRYQMHINCELALRRMGVTSARPNMLITRNAGRLNLCWQIQRNFRSVDIQKFLASCGTDAPFSLDVVNVQHSREFSAEPLVVELVDFGQYEVNTSFDRPLLVPDDHRGLLNANGVIWPSNDCWVQPDLDLMTNVPSAMPRRLPACTARSYGFPPDADFPATLALAMRLSSEMEQESIDRAHVLNCLDNFLTDALRPNAR